MGLGNVLHSFKVACTGSFTGERVTVQDSKRALFFMQVFYAFLLFLFRMYPENFRFNGWGRMCEPDVESGQLLRGGLDCLQRQLTLRFCGCIMVFFLLLIVMTLLNMGHFAMTKLFLVKFFLPLFLFFPSLALKDSVFLYIEAYGVIYSLHAFIFATVFVTNFGIWLNERIVSNRLDDFNNGYQGHLWRFTRHKIGFLFFVGSIIGTIVLLLKMDDVPMDERGSTYDVAYYSVIVNICVMGVITLLSSLKYFEQGCFLASSIVTAFLTTIIWGAVTYNPQVEITTEFAPWVVCAVLWLFLALAMSSNERERRTDLGSIYEQGVVPGPIPLDFGVNEIEKEWDCYSEGHGVEVNTEFQKEPKPALRIGRTLLYLLFHFSIPAAFMAMSSEALDIQYTLPIIVKEELPRVFWALTASSWLGILVYVWLLVAPFLTPKLAKKLRPVKIQKHVTKDVPLTEEPMKNSFYSSMNEIPIPSLNSSARYSVAPATNGNVSIPALNSSRQNSRNSRHSAVPGPTYGNVSIPVQTIYAQQVEAPAPTPRASSRHSAAPPPTYGSASTPVQTIYAQQVEAPVGTPRASSRHSAAPPPTYGSASIPVQTIYAEPVTTTADEEPVTTGSSSREHSEALSQVYGTVSMPVTQTIYAEPGTTAQDGEASVPTQVSARPTYAELAAETEEI